MFIGNKSASIRVVGKVQGVWFRDFTKKTATKYNLTGWVKNNIDGSVILLVEGNIENINALIKCLRSGSPLSQVDNVQTEWQPFENKFKSFKIIR
jgi:acylphosphatase